MATALMSSPETDELVDAGWTDVWKEHFSKQAGVKFGPDELARVVARCNARIQDTGDYAPLVLRHTSDDGSIDPPVVGFAGPFRMGRIGKNPPLASIEARFRFFESEVERCKRYPRVSVEYWFSKSDPTNGFFDPISLLGAETPELDLGIRYAKSTKHPGFLIARYSASRAVGSFPTQRERNHPMAATSSLRLTVADESNLRRTIERLVREECQSASRARYSAHAASVFSRDGDTEGFKGNRGNAATPPSVSKQPAHWNQGDWKPIDRRPTDVRRREALAQGAAFLDQAVISQIIDALRTVIKEMILETVPVPQAPSPEQNNMVERALAYAKRAISANATDAVKVRFRKATESETMQRERFSKEAASIVFSRRQRGERCEYRDVLREVYATNGMEVPA